MHLLKSRQELSPSPYAFTKDYKPIDEDWLTLRFKEYVREAGLDGRLHWHSLRHSFASWLVQRGATLYQIQHLPGHSSSSVMEVYSHLQPLQLHETVAKLSVKMNFGAGPGRINLGPPLPGRRNSENLVLGAGGINGGE